MNEKNETTCWENQQENQIPCRNKKCRLWLKCKEKQNCTIIAAQDGPKTLQQIGNLHGLTRMRICQVEKEALRKIRELVFGT
jgi:DNA-directed RNA polymerase sigma subunit (sigma70/sigma32)